MNFKVYTFTFLLITITRPFCSFSQQPSYTQTNYPHPVIELKEWMMHKGNPAIENIHAKKLKWVAQTLNSEWWEKNEVRWFKKTFTLSKELEGLDVILDIKVTPGATVFIKRGQAWENYGANTPILLLSEARAGQEISLAVKAQNGNYNCRFYQADLTGMPVGYGQYIQALASFRSLRPGNGLQVKEWKRKVRAVPEASREDFDDSQW
ncbi:MAG: hypothetical protein OEY51_14170, partial [Cyclobacteriaceae bacterium]|nr:hypothetical protein [Cyclobacteriaceae bacterium]